MPEPLLATVNLTKAFGALVVTDGLNLDVRAGEVHALIGPNGAGKTTLLNQLAGELRPDAGRILFAGRDVTRLPAHRRAHLGLARSFQITSVFLEMTALENVALAVQIHQRHSFSFWRDARRDSSLIDPARALLARIGLESRAGAPAADLSHGEHRQLEIAMAMAGAPRLLLLDEPTAGMGVDESRRLVELLRGLKGSVTILLVEHDMDTVFALADRITVLVYGRAIATDAPERIRASAEVRRAYLGGGTATA